MSLLRIFADILILISIFLLPWWVFAIFGLVFVFYFKSYYEILLAGLAMDSLYNTPDHMLGFFWSMFACAIFLVSFEIKKRYVFPQNI